MKGLDQFTRSLRDAQEALGNLDGELTTVRFDPEDPASIERAIQEMEEVIDQRVGHHAGNPMVASLVEKTKEHFRQALLDRAAQARAGDDEDDDT